MLGFSRTDFTESCEENKAYLYIINCYNDNEKFFKIGITKHLDLKGRFNSYSTMPYKFEIIKQIQTLPSIVFDLETKLHQLCKPFKYIPMLSFGGEQECFTNISEALTYVGDIINWMSVCVDIPVITNPVLNCKGGISKINFKELCKLYIKSIQEDDNLTQQDIEDFSPIFLEARKVFRANVVDDIKASAMQQTRLQQRIDIQSQAHLKMLDIKGSLPFVVGELYTCSDIKENIQKSYDKFKVIKTAKATDVEQLYEVKKCMKNGIVGYKILGSK